jgi:ADP-ribosylglycohydrolase
MVGLAVGDSVGAATEFLTHEEIRRRWPPSGVDSFQSFRGMRPGSYTDDTEMSIAVANGLLRAKDYSRDAIMESMVKEFIDWSNNTSSARAPGNTCMLGVSRLKGGVHWSESGSNDSKGCGTAMRSAPIGLAYHHALDALIPMASHVSLITHGHPAATAGSIATAFLVASSLPGTATDELLDGLIRHSRPVSEDFVRHVGLISQALDEESSKSAHELLGRGWVAEEAIAGAIYANIKHPDSFRSIILEAANSGGDTDSKACIAGAIAGARLGLEAIPSGWVEGIENRGLLLSIASDLLRLQGKLAEI